MKTVIITGGCGFIGHHFVEHFLRNSDFKIIVFDKLSYSSFGLARLRDIKAFNINRVLPLAVDLTRRIPDGVKSEAAGANYIIHLAAETHVDNSIERPMDFVYSNVAGTGWLLEFARELENLEAFNYFSTDEVFGPAPVGVNYKEWDRYNCTNPYSATKAGGEELCLAWANTYKLPVFVTHTMNVFGERQHPEKFIPLCIRKILAGEQIKIHSSPDKLQSGSRFYIHCRNVAAAAHFLLSRFSPREKYNVVGEKELSNLALAQMIADILGKPLFFEMVDFHSSRPGHDLRYSLDGEKMQDMGWSIPSKFESSLKKTVEWTVNNNKWLKG